MSAELDVRYIARLARLQLTEEETATFQAQLAHVLSYVEKLREVPVEEVEAMAHAHAVTNVFRPDEPRSWFTPEEALRNAPRAAGGLFIVPKVLE